MAGILTKLAEKRGVEPRLGLRLLAVFETAPFGHLGTSPARLMIQLIKIPLNLKSLCVDTYAQSDKIARYVKLLFDIFI